MSAVALSQAHAMGGVFEFLAGLFSSAPTQATVDTLRRLAAELDIDGPGEHSLAELAREYLELFVVPNPRYLAPYESVFRDEWPLPAALARGSNPSETGTKIKGLLMGPSTVKVRDCFVAAGVRPGRDLPDHIANELRLVAHLCRREAEAENGDGQAFARMRERFVADHLREWIGKLRQRVALRDRLGFYRAAIDVTAALLDG